MDAQMSIQNQTSVALLVTMHLLFTEANNTNCVFSPLSVHILLSIIASGAKGSTLNQMLLFLKSNSINSLSSLASQLVHTVLADGTKSGGPKLLTASRLWFEKNLSLNPSFRQIAETSFSASAFPADFAFKAPEVTKEVNAWVEKETNGLIKDILPPGVLDGSTASVIGNALYYKAAWSRPFNVLDTKVGDFHLLNGKTVRVPFMSSSKDQFLSVYEGFKVLRLPYFQGNDKRQFSMYVFLPDAINGLRVIARKVLSDPIILSQNLPWRQVPVGQFRIPRFKMSYGFEASKLLMEMGLTSIFSNGEADLSGIFDSPGRRGLFVSEIFHKSFIEVNEEGTEAAAASGAAIGFGASFQKNIDFVADHPFLFIIREDVSGVVLFTGQVLQPLVSN